MSIRVTSPSSASSSYTPSAIMSVFETPNPPYNSSDPTAQFVSTSCIDLLLIELVPMAMRLTPKAALPPDASGTKVEEVNADRDAVFFRLDSLGYKVGLGLVERFSRDRARFTDTLDVIKFLCKDVWNLCFKKQIDNLKTNHRGVYVLTDNAFRPLTRMSTDASGQAVLHASPYLWFPCGILRGALAAMDVEATVTAEIPQLPVAIFQITATTPPGPAPRST